MYSYIIKKEFYFVAIFDIYINSFNFNARIVRMLRYFGCFDNE